MALYQPNHDVGPGHGTRMGFRLASIFGIALFLGFLTFFIWGPRQAVTENPPAAENAQVEKQAAPQPAAPPAAPEQQAAPQAVTPQAPATTQPPATQDAQPPAAQTQPAAPQPAAP
jgi:hypothetical protein